MPTVKVSALQPGATIVLMTGELATVKEVTNRGTHKDALFIRLRGRPPLHVSWDADIEVVS